MLEMENKSYRGMLVEVIVKSFITDYLFDSKDGLKEILQEKLDLNLRFNTKVSEIETKNEHTFGKISFEDENGILRVIDFTITGSSVVV
jgi:NADPH-dependent 2,4-dienoyl-CoA reductase/sulfur reductase-like enzyme